MDINEPVNEGRVQDGRVSEVAGFRAKFVNLYKAFYALVTSLIVMSVWRAGRIGGSPAYGRE